MNSCTTTLSRDPVRLLLAFVVIAFSTLQISQAAYCTPWANCKWPSSSALASWASKLSNTSTVIFPEKTPDLFLSQAVSFNQLKSNQPALIVLPATEKDLRSAVAFAFKNHIRIVPRCSGVDFNGRSTGRGVMLIKTERLNSVAYDPDTQTVTFGSGASHADVYSAMAKVGRVYIGGSFKLVCPAGCLGGGCHGLFSRQHGLGIDNIVRIRLVLYNGTAINISASSHPALFNAYLGAGHSSFGVAVAFTARTYPAPPTILQLDVSLALTLTPPDNTTASTFPSALNALSAFFLNASWFEALPRTLAGELKIKGAAATATASFFYTGMDPGSAFAPLQPFLASPFVRSYAVKNFTDLVQVALTNFPPPNEVWVRRFAANAFIPPKQDLLDQLAAIILGARPDLWLNFDYGGAVRRGSAGVVPRGMRDAMYEVQLPAKWYDPRDDERVMAEVQRFLPALYSIAPYSYVNEYTTWGSSYNVMDDWKTRFFDNYDALLKVKKQYDPCNVFTVKYGVGSDLPAATC